MPDNVEIKARVRDVRQLERRIVESGAAGPEALDQTDTFYHCPHGRMKLREARGQPAELIVYFRSDRVGPRRSDYIRLAVCDAMQAKAVLGVTHGVAGVVRKTRRVFRLGGVRIHVDDVAGLGAFVELEVLLDERDERAAVRIANDLMTRLGIQNEDLVGAAYFDLLATGDTPSGNPGEPAR